VKQIEALGRRALALQGAVESLEDDERCVASAQAHDFWPGSSRH
jgi:hypothetical protein